ncbi:MAG: hypothetical protein ABJA70_05270 [Chryseolinea sp.]
MFEDYKICPYTGLRPFTEEESIYFKGRDEHIEQATRQLEKNKFIMLTGASGDGKSSLVYAGIIPNAKAGFLKASFSNWAVVDFRPERSPMGNLSEALAMQLGINADTVSTELRYGFSALVDIYKASPLYYDKHSAEWTEGDDRSKNERRRKAANLIILADQFEEFFTNPENFEKGVPSQEAMSVTNLLLETARIALEENLPIYVIVTMRSDFIGQCAAFRGLPEYIGFSQFFVPRLNRKELREVIEEPAVLSGNVIERRLTERLIHDIVEGTDQLPILQHALNQIWKMADEGASSMDLIHYAMVGGMPGIELPDEDAEKFNAWFARLPPNVQICYNQPDLQNVLNTHANKLYNQDADHLKETQKGNVSDDEAKMIIKAAFKCLTKINNSRAVRNRMTLGEITAIINVPNLDHKTVGKVLDIFREPGNTLLRPFLEETAELSPDDVLDITHESLIRNWENLEQWAKEEFNSYTISRDFDQQLNRWLESKRSNDFLLYIGPLTYFESWIKEEKPNAAWAARYLEGDQSKEAKLAKAHAIEKDSMEFLRRSARKHIVTRAVVRYGAGRIAAVLGVFALMVFSAFIVNNYWQQQNTYVLKQLRSTALSLSNEKSIIVVDRAETAIEGIMAGELTLPMVMSNVEDPLQRINVTTGIASLLVYQGTREPQNEILQSLRAADSLLSIYPDTVTATSDPSALLKEVNDLQDILELAYFYNPSPEIRALRISNSKRAASWVLNLVRIQPTTFTDIDNLNRLVEHAVNLHAFSNGEVAELINQLSPFGAKPVSSWVASNFAKDKICVKGFFTFGFAFNGLYQELAYLYAASGNSYLALKSIDSVLTYNKNYFQNDYNGMSDNATHVASAFYTYGNINQLDQFVSGYCLRAATTERDFYVRLLARSKLYELAIAVTEVDPSYDNPMNVGLDYSSNAQLDFFYRKYRQVINATVKDPAQRNFLTAISYKDQAILHVRKLEVTESDSAITRYTAMFDKAIELYRRIDPKYLNEKIQAVELTSSDNMNVSRKFLFLYPDVRTNFHPNEPQLLHFFFTSGSFLGYLLNHGLVKEFYSTEEELRYIELFMRDYHFVETDVVYTASKRMPAKVFYDLEDQLSKVNGSQKANLDFLFLYAGHAAAMENKAERVKYYYSQLTPEKLTGLFVNSFNPGYTSTLVGHAVGDLVRFDFKDEAERIVKMFQSYGNRISFYGYGAQDLLLVKQDDRRADWLIDSAFANSNRSREASRSSRAQLAAALTLRNKPDDVEQAFKVVKNIELKYVATTLITRDLAKRGRLFEASRLVNDNTSAKDNNKFTANIFRGYHELNGIEKPDAWRLYNENRLWVLNRPIGFIDESN